MLKYTTFIAVLLVCLWTSSVHAINFTLRQSEETCLSKDVMKGEYVAGEFSVTPEGDKIEVTVKDPIGASVYHKASISEGRFAYTSSDNGEYKVCFSNKLDSRVKSIKFKFLTGVEAKPSGAAKKKNLKPLEVQVRHLEEVVGGIRQDESWMVGRQELMKEVNDSTASYIFWFNVLTIIVVIGSYFGQLWYLKRFFKAKKLMVD